VHSAFFYFLVGLAVTFVDGICIALKNDRVSEGKKLLARDFLLIAMIFFILSN
jgi:hypothetical protein